MIQFQCTLKNETRLRHGTFCGIHQKNDAVYHLQNTLHLTAEVGVPGRVHNIDLDAVIVDCGILCKDCNAALAFEGTGVHDAGFNCLVFTKNTALFQHSVH